MTPRKPKSEALFVRVDPDTKRQFVQAAERLGWQPSDVLRELAMAFIEGRVTITAPPRVKEFYDVP